MNRNTLFLRTAVGLAVACAAAPGFAIDLMGSYERALKVDPTQLAADQALLAGREKSVQGSALLKPQIALSAGVSRVNDQSSGSLPLALSSLAPAESSGTVRQAALQLAQPLYDAKAVAEKRQLKQQAGLAEVNHQHARQDLMQRVGEAYFDVLLAQESLRVVQAEKTAMGLQRDRAQARFDVGRSKITDLQEAQARYDSVLTKEVSARSTLLQRQAQYHELTGSPAVGLAELRPGFMPVPPLPDDLPAWQGRGLQHNTRVQLKQGELVMAGAEVGKYRLQGRPTLDLVASYTYTGQNGNLAPDSSRSALVGLQFSVPLYAGGGLNSREREAIAKTHQAEQELSAAQRDARLQVQDAFLEVKTGVSRVSALQQSVLSARTALEATTLGRDVGSRTELDVLDAQQRLYAAQLDLAQARHGYLVGRLRLASAAGELQLDELRSLNDHLTP